VNFSFKQTNVYIDVIILVMVKFSLSSTFDIQYSLVVNSNLYVTKDCFSFLKMPVRDISPFLSKVRAVLLGRSHDNSLRFADKLATRSPHNPEIPEGPSHKLFANYYFTRDAKREVFPPTVISDSTKALVSGTEDGASAAATAPKSKTPGKLCRYSEFSTASPV